MPHFTTGRWLDKNCMQELSCFSELFLIMMGWSMVLVWTVVSELHSANFTKLCNKFLAACKQMHGNPVQLSNITRTSCNFENIGKVVKWKFTTWICLETRSHYLHRICICIIAFFFAEFSSVQSKCAIQFSITLSYKKKKKKSNISIRVQIWK